MFAKRFSRVLFFKSKAYFRPCLGSHIDVIHEDQGGAARFCFLAFNAVWCASEMMNIFSVASPALKAIFERLGKPEVLDQPALLKAGGGGAVIVSNHVGWADSLWLAYALYPRQLRFISKQELFSSPLSKWVFEQSGCIAIDRADPSPSSIKIAVDLLRQGELLLVFPSGTRSADNAVFKRGAATIALHAQVPIVPAFYRGPTHMHFTHLVGRPRVQIMFGDVIATAGLAADKLVAAKLTGELQAAIASLGMIEEDQRTAA